MAGAVCRIYANLLGGLFVRRARMGGMRFSLRWLFLLTTYVAILTPRFMIGQIVAAWLWLMLPIALLVSHIHR
jgi:hypothetical protein